MGNPNLKLEVDIGTPAASISMFEQYHYPPDEGSKEFDRPSTLANAGSERSEEELRSGQRGTQCAKKSPRRNGTYEALDPSTPSTINQRK